MHARDALAQLLTAIIQRYSDLDILTLFKI